MHFWIPRTREGWRLAAAIAVLGAIAGYALFFPSGPAQAIFPALIGLAIGESVGSYIATTRESRQLAGDRLMLLGAARDVAWGRQCLSLLDRLSGLEPVELEGLWPLASLPRGWRAAQDVARDQAILSGRRRLQTAARRLAYVVAPKILKDRAAAAAAALIVIDLLDEGTASAMMAPLLDALARYEVT